MKKKNFLKYQVIFFLKCGIHASFEKEFTLICVFVTLSYLMHFLVLVCQGRATGVLFTC